MCAYREPIFLMSENRSVECQLTQKAAVMKPLACHHPKNFRVKYPDGCQPKLPNSHGWETVLATAEGKASRAKCLSLTHHPFHKCTSYLFSKQPSHWKKRERERERRFWSTWESFLGESNPQRSSQGNARRGMESVGNISQVTWKGRLRIFGWVANFSFSARSHY